jgi:hypothetical protein
MWLGSAKHHKPGQPGRTEGRRGEAEPDGGRDEARLARQETEGLGQADLLTQALARANLLVAWKRVKANRGRAGADGLDIGATAAYLKTHWPRIREELQTGRYRPRPVRRVQIPKFGGGMRELGIPTVTDRLIQRALLLVLQPMIDPTFCESSYAFGRAGVRMMQCCKRNAMCKTATAWSWMSIWRSSSTGSITTSSWIAWPRGSPARPYCG